MSATVISLHPPHLTWAGILRLGLVQTSLGAIVVLMTAAINRVMVVELALPAVIPGLLVALFHGVQVMRPAWGHKSDVAGRRTPWIVGGMAALAIGGVLAASGAALAGTDRTQGLAVAALGFLLVGCGAGAAGTNVLATLAARVAPQRRAAAATLVWVMMIVGFAVTAPLAGHFLDPYSGARLIAVTSVVCVSAFVIASLAVLGVEANSVAKPAHERRSASFRDAFREVWSEPAARRFTVFIFVSMLAYSAQELLVEPFAGLAFNMPPGVTTKLAGLQHGGVLLGMIVVAIGASAIGGPRLGNLKLWIVGGCLFAAVSLVAVALTGLLHSDPTPLRVAIFALGVGDGIYAASAIGAMMGLASRGAESREGVRMGLWGAAQALALGAGGLIGAALVDISRWALGSALMAYGAVFVFEAVAFVAAALLATRIEREATQPLAQTVEFGSAPTGA
ncbi:MFS transporter [Rhodoblastus acidophilus]|uniref:MFS transporter n=1 Tax=Rhodoblastus acidophilus TaxID=1074 RepID=A0A6N8DJD0_RHOAC|nr:BCD family MFS transporter [Rhodoblastus acidophilus]MCW2273056.1 BCD family chlorophyll transporter-like MFS transporter [Rhodoblastus acidophilus]MTV29956.1 MFS transporter [Rhodoblastus acidophilus]